MKPWTRAAIPFAIFLLALLPRLHGLGRQPFWYDEILTVHRATLPWAMCIKDALSHHHSPLYFLLVRPFDHGIHPQFWMRLPSAVFGALSVMLVYLIAKRAAGPGAGIAAALILGLAPTEIAYSQEARSYTMEMACILLALHGLLGLVLARERAALHWRAPGAPMAGWIEFTAGSAAAFCTLEDSLPWLLAANLTAAILITQAQDRAGVLKNFLNSNTLALGACLPIYAAMLHFKGPALSYSFGFVPRPSAQSIWFETESIYLMRIADLSSFHLMNVPTPRAIIWAAGLGLPAAAAAGLWHLRRQPVLLTSLLASLLALPLCFGLISIWLPMMMVRYLLWSGAIFAILAGIGVQAALQSIRPSARPILLLAGAIVLAVNLAPFYDVETKPRWDLAAGIIATQSQPKDVFYFFEPLAAVTLRYYLPANQQTSLVADTASNLANAVQAQRQGRQLWVIYGDAAQRKDWESIGDFRASLAMLGRPSEVLHAGTRITIWRYAPPV